MFKYTDPEVWDQPDVATQICSHSQIEIIRNNGETYAYCLDCGVVFHISDDYQKSVP